MSESVNIDEISGTPLCAELSRESVATLARHMSATCHAKGEVLYAEGSLENNDLLLLLDGQLEIKTEQRYENIGSLRVVFESGAVASLMGFVAGHQHVTTATAISECRVARLSRDQFAHICESHPEIAIAVLKFLALRLDEFSYMLLDRYKDAQAFVQGAYRR
ncbi:MAG: hypothetical protein AUJ57_07130 [Zetaproteobacteria bacterium CG1_02_53_45]|nr:MAG: hypothetical protein AUJ57_07130 [Zetaproteobacteria bacterium CG1_02_53_45]